MEYAVPSHWPRARYHALTGEQLADIRLGVLSIYPGYAWDGMTCAPDWCPEASLVHDFGCQARTCAGFRAAVPQRDVDRVFREVMRERGFVLWPVYWLTVRAYQTLRPLWAGCSNPELLEFA